MGKHTKEDFLISLLVEDKDCRKKIMEIISNSTGSDKSLLNILKEEGYITIGQNVEDEICIEPDDIEYIDKLLYEYFRDKESEWTAKMG